MASLSRAGRSKVQIRRSMKTSIKLNSNAEGSFQGAKQEDAILGSQSMYQDLVEIAHEGITVCGPDDVLIFANKQFASCLGYRVDEAVGKSALFFATKKSATDIKNGTKLRMQGKKSRYEVTLLHKDGSKKHFILSASPMFTKSGKFNGSMAVYIDITEKRTIESKLQKKMIQIDVLHKIASKVRLIQSISTILKYASEQLTRVASGSDALQARVVFDEKSYSYPRKLDLFVPKIEFPIVVAGVKRGSVQIANKMDANTPISRDLDELIKNVARMLSKHMYTREITTRHKEIVNRAFTSIAVVQEGKITYANPRFAKTFRCKESDLIGRSITDFLPYCNLSNGTYDGRIRECTALKKDKGKLHIEYALLNTVQHGKKGILIRINDITDLKKAQIKLKDFNGELKKQVKEKTRHLEKANKRLQSLNEAKDEFITVVSHELRSPLTSIRGYLSFLMEDEALEYIPQPYSEYLARAYGTTDSLNYLINNILDVSRIDMERFELHVQQTDIIKLISNILNSVAFQAGEKKLSLNFDNQTGDSELSIFIDSIRISQVLRNVLDNSIKFTRRGKKIEVSIKKFEGMLSIEISDQGVGIPKAKMKQIFDKFAQIKNTNTGHKGGVGLGLFLCRRIIEKHHGKIDAKKNEDGGTTITLHLPLVKTSKLLK